MSSAKLARAAACIAEARRCLETLGEELARRSQRDGRLDGEALQAIQPEAFALALSLAGVAAAEAALDWGRAGGDLEADLAISSSALACQELLSWAGPRRKTLGLGDAQLPGEAEFIAEALATPRLSELGARILRRSVSPGGDTGLAELHRMVRQEMGRFADEHLQPAAEQIHRADRLVPEALLQAMAKLGVFGISVPEAFGGCFVDHRSLVVATEELSRGSLGAGGSVMTRPEICAKALLKGGTEAQKQEWLPPIARGEKMVAVAVTEPDAGSDVASLRLRAERVEGGYRLHGEKTWCTFAGRADVLVLLARTGRPQDGHRGLSLFLVEKPGTPAGQGDEYSFSHQQGEGGQLHGRAIPTIGYRGMHSFAVQLDGWYVPEANRIGAEGQGFYLCMEGFSGGRLQTAARAVGLMEAAFREALRYARERQVFGHTLGELPLSAARLCEMAARIQASRQLSYRVADRMDRGEGSIEAAQVKLLACRDAEWVTRQAMQLHGGMGYAEEFPVSRYWQDARVLSIFEGSEEVLALRVIARPFLQERLG